MKHSHDFPHSSSIQKAEYHEDKQELHITFSSGGTHCFKDCPKEEFDSLKEAKSPGGHFHQNIRKTYKSEKVGD